MKKLLLVLLLTFIGNNLLAIESPAPKEICSLLNINAKIFIFDKKTNKLLYQREENRDIRFGGIPDESKDIVCQMKSRSGYGDSNFGSPKELNIYHEWNVLRNGEIQYLIRQFSDKEFKKLLKEEKGIIKEMNAVSWTSLTHKDQRVVIRFTPSILDEEAPKDFSKLPIVGKDIAIIDNGGILWMQNFSTNGSGDIYLRITTYKGTLFLSYYPFKGSKLLGHVRHHEMHLNIAPKKNITITSKTPFVLGDMALNVYGIYDEKLKTSRADFGSVSSSASDKEENFLKVLK